MSMKEYLEKKKGDWDKYKMKKDMIQQEQSRKQAVQMKLDAQSAQSDLSTLKEQDKHRRQIQEYKDYKQKHKAPSRFGSAMSGMSDFASGFDVAKSKKKSDSIMGDINMGGSSGGSDMFSGMFGSAPKKHSTKRKKRTKRSSKKGKSKGKTITIHMS
jgi:hypothetical protein